MNVNIINTMRVSEEEVDGVSDVLSSAGQSQLKRTRYNMRGANDC